MTIWERLFGTPEATTKTLNEVVFGSQDFCWMLDALSSDKDVKCRNCMYDYDGYGCEPKDMRIVEWLMQEVSE